VYIRDRVLFKSVLVYRHRQSGIACPNLGILRSFWLRTYGCREGKWRRADVGSCRYARGIFPYQSFGSIPASTSSIGCRV
jgi:hypothetical protein